MAKKQKPVGAIVVSDLHVGSNVGLWPPDGETEMGNTVGFGKNIHQAWLWETWLKVEAAAKRVFGNDPFVLVANGDLMEGSHHHSKEVVAAEEHDHAVNAVRCLRPLVDLAAESYFVRGTECHVKNFEKYIANQLGGVFAGDALLLEIQNTLVEAKHHMPTASRAYLEAGALSIVMGNARLNYARCGHRIPKVFLRGHRHVGGVYSDGSSALVVTGAFQLLTRYGKKVVGESLCRPAFAILDWRNSEPGGLPFISLPTYDPNEQDIIQA